MAIPKYNECMLPLLRLASDGNEHSMADAREFLGNFFSVTDNERKEVLPSGTQLVFDNRVHWAKFYLTKAGLLLATRRGYFKITDAGLKVLNENPPIINIDYLKQFEEFSEFFSASKKNHDSESSSKLLDQPNDITPEESLEQSYQSLRQHLASELLSNIKACSDKFFEKLCVELLVKMGYGGSIKDAGRAIGKAGDGGIDGIIKEDKLGLDIIYIQAKRWDDQVISRPEIQKFAGALQGHRAKKGVFITTSTFSSPAVEFAQGIESKIVLIDGELLSDLMIDYGLGVSLVKNYEIKKIDTDYFSEE